MKKLLIALMLSCMCIVITSCSNNSDANKIQPPSRAEEVSKIYVETEEQVVHALEKGSTHCSAQSFINFLNEYSNDNVKIDSYKLTEGATCSEVVVSFYLKGDSTCYTHSFITEA